MLPHNKDFRFFSCEEGLRKYLEAEADEPEEEEEKEAEYSEQEIYEIAGCERFIEETQKDFERLKESKFFEK